MNGGADGGGVVNGSDDRIRDRSFMDRTVSVVLDGSIGLTCPTDERTGVRS